VSKLRWRALRKFGRYTLLSLITLPVAYTFLLVARHTWHMNAGLLNLALSAVLAPPSFFLHRWIVWPGGGGRSIPAEMFSFFQTVLVGTLGSSAVIALADSHLPGNEPLIVLSGLTGQGLIFIGRYFWLDRVTFSPERPTARPTARPITRTTARPTAAPPRVSAEATSP